MSRLFDYAETSPFGLPTTSGVYAVCIRGYDKESYELLSERILYIGSSKNMQKRCLNTKHPYRICYDRFENYCVYTKSIETENYIEMGKKLINIYKPLLNKNNK